MKFSRHYSTLSFRFIHFPILLSPLLFSPLAVGAATVPTPKISVSPTSLTFTSITVNTSESKSITITNKGTAALDVGSIFITGSQFSQTNTCTSALQPNDTCSVTVTFSPVEPAGKKSAAMTIPSNDPKRTSPVTVKLSGQTSTSYTLSDLAGTWNGSVLDTGSGTQTWRRMTFNISPSGSYTGSWVDSNGNSKSLSGTFSISSAGIMTDKTNEPNLWCSMDAGKTVFGCTDTRQNGNTELDIFVKQGASYEQSDFEGKWLGNYLGAGTGGNVWMRATFNFDSISYGFFTGTMVDSNRNVTTPAGFFFITPEGVVTLPVEPNLQCNMDASKTVMACTDTPSSGNVELTVFTKSGAAYTLADLAGTWSSNSLPTGLDAPGWNRVTSTARSNGAFSCKDTYYDGTKTSTKSCSGSFLLGSEGVQLSTSFTSLCQVNANETVMVCTDNWGDGTTELVISTRGLK
jgi:hypothetical protein